MRKLAALSVAAVLALSVAALADGSNDRTIVGTVSHVDTTAKSMVVKDSTGSNVTVYWNDSTKLDAGVPAEGATVSVTIDGKDQGANPMAKSISIQAPKKPY
jgi:hypothetical protein